ncbi:MAG: CDP-alcohol phosphatidyltransferase family protein [Ignavibacteriota bacterium]
MPSTLKFRTSDKILTLSNSISFLRIFLIIPTLVYFLKGDLEITGALMVLAYITDLVDGYVARRTNTISEFGKALDPLADKLFVAALIIAMVSKELVPLWFVMIVLGKDILIMLGILAIRKRIGAVLPSNYWGKSAALLTIVCLFLAVRGVSPDILVFGWIASTVLIAISFMIYAVRALKLYQASATAES